MSGFTFDPVEIAQEVNELNQKLASGIDILTHLEKIDVGLSDKQLIYSDHIVQLYRYTPLTAASASSTPILIVPPLINRPYILDLQPDRSFIRRLLEQGLTVYLIDWGTPERADRYLSTEDYVTGFLRRCIKKVIYDAHAVTLNLMGTCQGGIFALAAAALYPERIKNLILINTPIDFHSPLNPAAHLLQNIKIDELVDSYGNIPGEMISTFFVALNPFRTLGKKTFEFIDHLDDRERALYFLRINKWIYDCPDHAGEIFREFISRLLQENLLVKNQWQVGEKRIDLNRLTLPQLNLFSDNNQIVPGDASRVLEKLTGSDDYTSVVFKHGHIGLFVNHSAQKEVAPLIRQWLCERDE
jgi:polyhydroxyalkanoate synthase